MSDEIRSGEELERDGRGHFLPGVSGNPAGRPPGRRDKRVNAREELLGPLLPAAIEKLAAAITKAKSGRSSWSWSTRYRNLVPSIRMRCWSSRERFRDLEELARQGNCGEIDR